MLSSLLAALQPFASAPTASSEQALPDVYCDEDADEEPTRGGGAAVRRLHYDEDAAADHPTGVFALFDLEAAGRSHAGTRRATNEDAMLLLDAEGLYVVADGMGGHDGGEVASRLAVEALATTFLEDSSLKAALLANVPPRAVELVQGFAAANEAVRSAAAQDRRLAEMGTTLVAARFCPKKGRVYVGHVGDSRCYRLRDGALERLTRDHTMAELGFVGREAQRLSRAVGSNGIVEADLVVLEPRGGDVFLLCSDGINKTLSDETIREVLSTVVDPKRAANELIARANAAGARDNVTAVVVRVRDA